MNIYYNDHIEIVPWPTPTQDEIDAARREAERVTPEDYEAALSAMGVPV